MKSKEKQSRTKTESFLVRLDPHIAGQVRQWSLDHRMKIQAMLELGLEHLMQGEGPVIDGQKRLSTKAKKSTPKETGSAYNLHNALFQEWVERVILVFNSCNSGAIEALARNLVGFLAALAGLQKRGIIVDINNGSTEDAPDYAAAAEAAQDSCEQLRRLLEGMRKRRRGFSQE